VIIKVKICVKLLTHQRESSFAANRRRYNVRGNSTYLSGLSRNIMITHNLAQNDTSTDDKGGCDEIIIMVFLVFAKL